MDNLDSAPIDLGNVAISLLLISSSSSCCKFDNSLGSDDSLLANILSFISLVWVQKEAGRIRIALFDMLHSSKDGKCGHSGIAEILFFDINRTRNFF